MIILLLIVVFQLSAIGFLLERSLYTPFKKNQDELKLKKLQIQWEKDRKESREKAKDFNKIK